MTSDRRQISLEQWVIHPFDQWDKQWMVLAAGSFKEAHYNAMTVAWGGFGVMWGRPFAMIVVRPTRYTFAFLEKHQDFTLGIFAESYRPALQLLGSKSGRAGNKIAEAGLTPAASLHVAAPGFAEAALTVECRKMYRQDMDPAGFIDPGIEKNYAQHDYHRMYFGEILAVTERVEGKKKI